MPPIDLKYLVKIFPCLVVSSKFLECVRPHEPGVKIRTVLLKRLAETFERLFKTTLVIEI